MDNLYPISHRHADFHFVDESSQPVSFNFKRNSEIRG
jgi:hypothetical protein